VLLGGERTGCNNDFNGLPDVCAEVRAAGVFGGLWVDTGSQVSVIR